MGPFDSSDNFMEVLEGLRKFPRGPEEVMQPTLRCQEVLQEVLKVLVKVPEVLEAVEAVLEEVNMVLEEILNVFGRVHSRHSQQICAVL